MVRYQLKIEDIIDEAEGTKTYIFKKPENFTWEEGSHTHIGFVGFDEGEQPNKNWVRHMSIMTLPDENKIGITTRVPGSSSEFKNKLSKIISGDEVVLFKLGSRMSLKHSNRPVILLSMGVGIATMRPVILAYIKDNSNIPSLINVNIESSGEFIFKEELDKFENHSYKNYWLDSRLDFYNTLQQLTEIEKAIYYIVGSDVFIKDIIQLLREKNVNDMDIIIDKKAENLHEYFII
jgi:ferredoxin--NADP+ reductase